MNKDRKVLCPQGHVMHLSTERRSYEWTTPPLPDKWFAHYWCDCEWIAPTGFGKTEQEAVDNAYLEATKRPQSRDLAVPFYSDQPNPFSDEYYAKITGWVPLEQFRPLQGRKQLSIVGHPKHFDIEAETKRRTSGEFKKGMWVKELRHANRITCDQCDCLAPYNMVGNQFTPPFCDHCGARMIVKKEGKAMKYFETNDPYYALIAAETEEEATKIYTETVTELDEDELEEFELAEISEEKARKDWDDAMKRAAETGDTTEPFEQVTMEQGLLLVDGVLL